MLLSSWVISAVDIHHSYCFMATISMAGSNNYNYINYSHIDVGRAVHLNFRIILLNNSCNSHFHLLLPCFLHAFSVFLRAVVLQERRSRRKAAMKMDCVGRMRLVPSQTTCTGLVAAQPPGRYCRRGTTPNTTGSDAAARNLSKASTSSSCPETRASSNNPNSDRGYCSAESPHPPPLSTCCARTSTLAARTRVTSGHTAPIARAFTRRLATANLQHLLHLLEQSCQPRHLQPIPCGSLRAILQRRLPRINEVEMNPGEHTTMTKRSSEAMGPVEVVSPQDRLPRL